MSEETPPLFVPEAYRYTLDSRGALSLCLLFGASCFGALFIMSAAYGWVPLGVRIIMLIPGFAMLMMSQNHMFPCYYGFDEDGIWRIYVAGSPDKVRFAPSRRWWQSKRYQRQSTLLVRPSQIARWQCLRWKDYPTIVITFHNREQRTLCMRRDFPGSPKEEEVRKRLTEWAALPPTEDDGELEIHWDEVPEELKRWV